MENTGRQPVTVRWSGAAPCRVTLVAESFDRSRLLADLTEVIAATGAAIVAATVEPPASSASATRTRCGSPTRPACPP